MVSNQNAPNFFDVIIVGSGAAGLACAGELVKQGISPQKICIITEKLGGGTSFNAGSDKQTYYRLSLVGEELESPVKMANSLIQGGAMHGDIALIEATGSIKAFYNLVNLGIPFPHNQYGTYVGYKTDNDPCSRGTSVGPLTSKIMGEKLLEFIQSRKVPLLDHHFVYQILKDGKGNYKGILCFDFSDLNLQDPISSQALIPRVKVIQSHFLVVATGGPASIYLHSVYPESQMGSLGLLIDAGAWMQNLTESQYGIASLKPRWNLSGTYQQVIPRYISLSNGNLKQKGEEEPYEFLQEYFTDFSLLSKATFLKGYQWPFNVERINNFGSSLIDIAIYIETVIKKRHVFVDFVHNPSGFNLETLSQVAKDYLSQSNALLETPFERLKKMNPKAIELYTNKGIDLSSDYLEVAICAQHCNGGVTGDIWWETSVRNVFAIGEVNGTHGVHRPGGSALNSGQVGAFRAAQKIAYRLIHEEDLSLQSENDEEDLIHMKEQSLSQFMFQSEFNQENVTFGEEIRRLQERMMEVGAFIRPKNAIENAIRDVENQFQRLNSLRNPQTYGDFLHYWQLNNALLTQKMFLQAIHDYCIHKGGSRGSALVLDELDKFQSIASKSSQSNRNFTTPDVLALIGASPNNPPLEHTIQMIRLKSQKKIPETEIEWVPCRPIPPQKLWFEDIWEKYDSGKVFSLKKSYFP